MNTNNTNELIKTTIKEREVIYYLVTENDLNDIKSKSVLGDIFMLFCSLGLGGFVSVFIAKETGALSLLIWLFLIVGVLFLLLTIYFFLQRDTTIKKIATSGEVKSFAKTSSIEPFEIIRATYGTSDKTLDITDIARGHIKNGKLVMKVDNNLKGDPHINVPKKGIITYKVNGIEMTKAYKEGDTVNLP
ncbi:MAG: hypothetical protein HY811_05205 [Planctomycetes bacterium]|nr:hypothetical protein [Planctomycetota bacterium]